MQVAYVLIAHYSRTQLDLSSMLHVKYNTYIKFKLQYYKRLTISWFRSFSCIGERYKNVSE